MSHGRRSFCVGLAAALAACASRGEETSPAASGNVALVVGEQRYRSLPALRNTASDARLVAGALQNAGFAFSSGGPQYDLGRVELELALRRFIEDAAGASTAVFYYAGHGLQITRENWLVPVDAPPPKFGTVTATMIDVGFWLRRMGDLPGLCVALVDACRDNPFLAPGIVLEQGLAPLPASPRLIVGLSAQPGHAALDGFGPNGPYAEAIARAFASPRSPAARLLAEAGESVWRLTGGAEEPWMSAGSGVGERPLVSA